MPALNSDFTGFGTERTYDRGSVILRQGQLTTSFHTIVSGLVDILVGENPQVRVATLGPGEFFGEMSCLTGNPVSATVVATTQVVAAEIDREGLLELLDSRRDFRQGILQALVNRVGLANTRVELESVCLQVMTEDIHSEGESRYGELVGQSETIKNLRLKIQRLVDLPGPIMVSGEPGTGKRHIAARLHFDGPRRGLPLFFINALEYAPEKWKSKLRAAREGTLVLYKSENLPSELIEDLLKRAGPTKLVITGENLPDLPGPARLHAPPLREYREDIPALARYYLQRTRATKSLQTISSAAMRRLTAYPFLAENVTELFQALEHAQVFASGMQIQPEHLELGRLKRTGGRPLIGLALGGGAVRGVAHLGVLRVLEEEGIPVDLISGSSAGSLVGGLYAAGVTVSEMEKIVKNLRWSRLIRPVWPRLALTENSRMGAWLRELIGSRDFADLRIPFACVAADALTGEAVIIKSGCLIQAIRASTAIPLMMTPVRHGERVLVDGGIVHRVPAVLARSMGADLVIAVDVSVPVHMKSPPRNLLDALLGVIDTMTQHMVEDELEWADILLRPKVPVSGYGFHNAPLFLEQGEIVTRENIGMIRRKMGELAEQMA